MYGTEQYNTKHCTQDTTRNTQTELQSTELHVHCTLPRGEGPGGGGERKGKADIYVAEDMNCKMKVNMNMLANIICIRNHCDDD